MALGPGSIAFVGINTSSTDWFAFAAMQDIAAGQVIYFTDNELATATSTTFNTGESYLKWTAPAGGVAAGTVVNFTSLPSSVPGTVPVNIGTASAISFTGSANTGLSNGQDSLYAYTAAGDATADTPTAFLSFISIGTPPDAAVPASLSSSQEIVFDTKNDSAYYTGARTNQTTFAGYDGQINNAANWTQASGATDNSTLSTTAFVLDTPPTLTSSTPADNSTSVSPTTNISLTFSEAVVKGTGNIEIRDSADNSLVQTIDVTSAAVTVSGSTVTIDPPADLAPNHGYYLDIASGAILDTTGNSYAGISDATTLNFTTASSETQTVAFDSTTLSVTHNEGQSGTTAYSFTVTRVGGTTGDASFSGAFTSSDTDDADYVGGKPASFNGTILAGQSSATVTVDVAGDTTLEANESFSLTLNTVSNNNAGVATSLGGNVSATGTIVNDDGFLVLTGQTLTTPQTLADQNSGVVQSGGTLAVDGGKNTIAAVTWTGGATTISNSGTISATSTGTSRAIDTGSTLPAGSSLLLTNAAGARLLAATNDAVRVNSSVTNGSITINNSGWIVSGQVDNSGNISGTASGQGIDLSSFAAASSHATITNAANAIIGAAADDGIRPGTNTTINNYGLIIGKNGQGSAAKSDGIDAQANLGVSLHNFAGGSIIGARDGLTGNYSVLVTNDASASILGMMGSGLNMDTQPGDVQTVVNHGTITGTAVGDADGDGIDADGPLSLFNDGLVRAVGLGTVSLNEALAIGGGVITNAVGGLIWSDQRAITVNNSNEGGPAFVATTIINSGTIRGDDGQAISIVGTFADTITNFGTILGSVDMGDGNDLYNDIGGSHVTGEIDGGAGNDTMSFDITKAQAAVVFNSDGSVSVTTPTETDQLVHFETLQFTDGTEAIACFCRGTMISTENGDVPVETLAIGDRVATLSGALKPIKWIGRRGYAGRFIAGSRVLPILIQADALADGMPARDLWVSPEHALYLDDVLVPARCLINGATITQAETVEKVEYFHIELDTHDVIFAEGAPTETFVDCDNRLMFANASEFDRLYPEDGTPRWQFAAPRLDLQEDARLAEIRAKLIQRARLADDAFDLDPDLHAIVDGVVVRPQGGQGSTYRFAIPAGSTAICLASRSTIPALTAAASRDTRRLGVPVDRFVLSDGVTRIEAWHGHPSLGEGFNADEPSHRWTDGLARLPALWPRLFEGGFNLEVHLIANDLMYPTRTTVKAA